MSHSDASAVNYIQDELPFWGSSIEPWTPSVEPCCPHGRPVSLGPCYLCELESEE